MDQPKEPANKPKTEAELAQEFIKAYQELVEKHQMRLVITPIFISTNHGSFEVALQESVGRLPKNS